MNWSKRNNRAAREIALAMFSFLWLAVPAVGQIPLNTRSTLAEALLPDSARAGAKIIVRDATGESVIRNGDGFICVSDSSRPGRVSLNCHHETLEEQIKLEGAIAKEGFRGKEFTQRLCERAEARGFTVPDGAIEISASIKLESDGSLPHEMTVYYLMYLPQATTTTLGIVDEDPGGGSPWLHMAGSCQAHVMWSEARPIPK